MAVGIAAALQCTSGKAAATRPWWGLLLPSLRGCRTVR